MLAGLFSSVPGPACQVGLGLVWCCGLLCCAVRLLLPLCVWPLLVVNTPTRTRTHSHAQTHACKYTHTCTQTHKYTHMHTHNHTPSIIHFQLPPSRTLKYLCSHSRSRSPPPAPPPCRCLLPDGTQIPPGFQGKAGLARTRSTARRGGARIWEITRTQRCVRVVGSGRPCAPSPRLLRTTSCCGAGQHMQAQPLNHAAHPLPQPAWAPFATPAPHPFPPLHHAPWLARKQPWPMGP